MARSARDPACDDATASVEGEAEHDGALDVACARRRWITLVPIEMGDDQLRVCGLGGAGCARRGARRPVGFRVLMRAHGSVACGPTLQAAVFRAVYTEVNARIQHWATALKNGETMAALDAEEGRLADVNNEAAGKRAWELWRSKVRAEANW